MTLSAGSFPMLVAVVAINIRAQINAFDLRLLFIGIWFLAVKEGLDFGPGSGLQVGSLQGRL